MVARGVRSAKRAHVSGETVILPSGAAIRPDLVAHAKTLLQAGLVGKDMRRLADRLVEIAIDEGEWLWPSDR